MVGIAAAGAVPGRIGRLERDLRTGPLLVAQCEEGDINGRIGNVPAGAGVKRAAHAHAAARTGLRQAIDRQSRPPLVDIVLLVQVLDDGGLGVDDDLALDVGAVAVPPVAPGAVCDRDPQQALAVGKPQCRRIDPEFLRRAADVFQPQKTGCGKGDIGEHDVLAVLAEFGPESAQAALRIRKIQGQLRRFADEGGRRRVESDRRPLALQSDDGTPGQHGQTACNHDRQQPQRPAPSHFKRFLHATRSFHFYQGVEQKLLSIHPGIVNLTFMRLNGSFFILLKSRSAGS